MLVATILNDKFCQAIGGENLNEQLVVLFWPNIKVTVGQVGECPVCLCVLWWVMVLKDLWI